MKTFDLVIFDMDGLMFDTERRYCDYAEEYLKLHDIKVNMTALYDVIGTTLPIDMKKFNYTNYDEEKINSILDESLIAAHTDMCRNGVPLKKGLFELLNTLKMQNIKMVVATSTPIIRSSALLKAAKVYDYFEFIITSEDVEHGKPEPDIFIHACRKANVSYDKAFVLEDSINGCRAAMKAGIPFIVIPDINQPTQDVKEAAYLIADNLLVVADLFS